MVFRVLLLSLLKSHDSGIYSSRVRASRYLRLVGENPDTPNKMIA